MDRSKKILLIVIGVIICIVCGVKACNKVAGHLSFDETISTISEAIASDPNLQYDNAELYAIASEGSMETQKVREIQIEWVNGDITVQYGDQDQITWKESYSSGEPSDANRMRYYLDEDELKLAFCAAGTQGFKGKSRNIKKELIVTLPQAWKLNELDIDNVNGTITTLVNTNDINIEIVNGSSYIYLPEGTAFKAEFDKVNGGFSTDFPIERHGNTYTSGAAPYMDIEVEVVNGSLNIKQL